jgi:hypothetical protein
VRLDDVELARFGLCFRSHVLLYDGSPFVGKNLFFDYAKPSA